MRQLALEGDLLTKVLGAIGRAPMFRGLSADQLKTVLGYGALFEFCAGEPLMEEGGPSDSFFVVLGGSASVRVGDGAEGMEIAHLKSYDCVGEIGVLLEQPRSATVIAEGPRATLALKFPADAFSTLFQRVPSFALATCTALASRVYHAFRRVPIPDHDSAAPPPEAEVVALLPLEFMQRHRVLPLRSEGNRLTLGCVDDPTPAVLTATRRALPGMAIEPVRIDADVLTQTLEGQETPEPTSTSATSVVGKSSPRLDRMLERVVAEGASDLHLAGSQPPQWRLHGDMKLLSRKALGREEVLELLTPIMPERCRAQFVAESDTDFAYSLGQEARFRVNVFRDLGGVGAVLRQIPVKILTIDQLGLPKVVRNMCEHPKGLVLVTGPTGSGKSTTLAAMVDHINKTRPTHIITLEDPVEFVHQSYQAMVNQREIGEHTQSFARALRAALREDPDVVLVGEMRDHETIALALETANTGHLVFGTLHTSTAVTTVDRIINVFSPEEQPQIRATLSDVMKGVIAQTLCKKLGGGRIAAFEIMVSSPAVSNLIREGKTYQIPSTMMTSRALGNSLLNEELSRLVKEKKVDYAEAQLKTLDKADLAKKCGREPPVVQ